MVVAPDTAGHAQRLVPPLSMAVPLTIALVAVLAIPLATAQALAFTPQQTGSWLFALYAIPGVLSLVLTRRYHQPLFLGWNGFVIASTGSLTNSELGVSSVSVRGSS
jgi:predicted benzoate:H+ symporter BenE